VNKKENLDSALEYKQNKTNKGWKFLILAFIFGIININAVTKDAAKNKGNKFNSRVITKDTLPSEKPGDNYFLNKNRNPYDVNTSLIKREVNYDPVSGRYVLTEKIGEELYREPTYMTFNEYLQYKSQEQERTYFESLNGFSEFRNKNLSDRLKKLDPMSKIDLGKSMIDRLFGGTEYNIKPRGSVDLTLGFFSYQKNEDPSLLANFQRQLFIPGDFNMRPRLSVDGGIGEKLKLNFNYDNQNTFNFDRQIKLRYDSDQFSEDDILKKIEAGNVNLPLRGSLIPGVQNLFGVKTDLQFGHLKLSFLAAQQQSRRNSLQVQNGSAIQDIEVRPDEYDENRHFFVSHFNRATYERTLENLPQINTSFRIAQMEVWISDDRPDYQQGSAMIAALSDLGESDLSKYTSGAMTQFPPVSPLPTFLTDITGIPLPDNKANNLFDRLVNDPGVNQIDKTSAILSGPNYRLRQNRDFEVFRGRLLNSSEYTFNPQLGTISLNIRLRPNQVLAVSYKYFYTARCDTIYTVGQIASEGLESSSITDPTGQQRATPPKVIFTKLLKSTNQVTNIPSWDLMMKNVYNLQTSSLNREGFDFDIFYEDDFDDGSLKKFLPEESLRNIPLLQLFGVDRLNRFGDPQADGAFDYIPGVTIIERTGSIVFPVLEPFGSTLDSLITDPALRQKYVFKQLYDTTITIARQNLELNKFVMKARVRSANTGEYNLGGLFIQRGSVRVTAGGVLLQENVDYEIDYGVGRLRVINPAYLSQGTPININFEDNAIFGLQSKNMLAMRAEYDFGKKLSIGGTAMRLWDRPFTQKVNIGEDPINNKMYGLDMNYADETPWLTKALDKLPFYSTNAPSSISFFGEAAYMQPGYSKAINLPGEKDPVVSLDDFEGAINGLSLGGFNTNSWMLSSVPSEFPESQLTNDVLTGVNRARINWYQIERSGDARKTSVDRSHPYTRIIEQDELFNRELQIGQNELFTFDVGYYPNERGPYNFDKPGGNIGLSAGVNFDPNQQKFFLNNPASRWGGIMRYFQNSDFEAANYEFIDFWVLNPFMDRPDGIPHVNGETGEIIFQLGNISEDILKDGLQFFENGLPRPDDPRGDLNIIETNLARVPINIPIVNGFDGVNGKTQDLGLNGMNDDMERVKHADWVEAMNGFAGQPVQSIIEDPAGDNFRYFGDKTFPENEPLLTRLKDFNNPQGNAPLDNANQGAAGQVLRGNRFPDSEDLNNNRSLDQGESYFHYVLEVRNQNGFIDSTAAGPYYRQSRTTVNSSGQEEVWYRFQIPLNGGIAKDITGFRAIQFMRMYFTKFSSAKTFRFADFQLVRSSWRRSNNQCVGIDSSPNDIDFSVDEIGVEENGTKLPFNYRTPKGIKQERLFGTLTNLLQDEKSMVLNFCNLQAGCQIAVNKLSKLDLNLYKKLQLFVHLESKDGQEIEPGSLSIFVKLGKDMQNNYYEYEMPIRPSTIGFPSVADSIWLEDNFVDIVLEKFKDLKLAKLKDGVLEADDPDMPGAKLRIKGVPSLGFVKIMEIGVKNNDPVKTFCGEVWINELRATGLSQRGGLAAQGRFQAKLADLGELNVTGNLSTIGFGGIDQRLQERAQEQIFQYNIATNLNLGKLLPKFIPLNVPFYAQYSKQTITPLFDPYQLDITVEQAASVVPEGERDAVYERSRETVTTRSLNMTNVRVEGTSTNKPWSPQNLTASYAFNETNRTDPIIQSDLTSETQLNLEYNYATKGLSIQPLKSIKSKYLKLLSEFNFNLLPNRIGFNTGLNRYRNSRAFRFPDVPVFQFDDSRFRWERNYNLDWELTKAIRLTFTAKSSAIVDELRQVGIAETREGRPWVNELGEDFTQQVNQNPGLVNDYRNDNLANLGRTKNYTHSINLTYSRLPFHLIPMMDWITASADYRADYNWNGGALITIDETGTLMGNMIQNTQARSANANLEFSKLYEKWGYLKKIQGTPAGRQVPQNQQPRTRTRPDANANGPADTRRANDSQPSEPSIIEKILIRPLLTLRSVKFSYREDLGTSLPGFMPQATLFGLEKFNSPGWAFAAGLQPNIDPNDGNNYLQSNRDNFNSSVNFNDQIMQNQRQNISSKIMLEPFRDFVVDVDFIKNYRRDHTEVFKSKENDFMQIAKYDIGSFDYTNFGMNSIFQNSRDVYARYKFYKLQASENLANRPGSGRHPQYPDFAEGYGPTSYAVNVPAFLAAYTGQDLGDVNNKIQDQVKAWNFLPKPNWALRYDGLAKLPMFKNILSSFTLRHAYKSVINIARFNTAPDFTENNPWLASPSNNNYYSQLEIPMVTLQEGFNPLIGIQMKTKSNLNLNFEYRRTRNMDLRLNANELGETNSREIVFGMGYAVQNFKGFKKANSKKRPTRAARNNENQNTPTTAAASPLTPAQNRTLTFNSDFSFRDDKTEIYRLENDLDPQPQKGGLTISFKPNIEYQMYKNLSIRLFADYSRSVQYTINPFPLTRLQAGTMVRFNFN
jgi:cell surface protein SprA